MVGFQGNTDEQGSSSKGMVSLARLVANNCQYDNHKDWFATCDMWSRPNFQSSRPTTRLLQEQCTATHQRENMSKIIFLPSEDEVLVQEVQNNPVLYNIAEANYKNNVMKDDIQKNISIKIGKSCKLIINEYHCPLFIYVFKIK